eukprot:CAMPEP_0184321500 /NCGR_PEP_ID=MMETSP1049-20130417/119344_1 /TAXON_ID=77928 /ORGANISM="Proteomonas sulcata, Strain CCMP704" /LENGTH=91 /DNA_ID=CAMNT_0026642329 /DNA_START=525 /DNA_END=800 /DNA_ORIENTATION=+
MWAKGIPWCIQNPVPDCQVLHVGEGELNKVEDPSLLDLRAVRLGTRCAWGARCAGDRALGSTVLLLQDEGHVFADWTMDHLRNLVKLHTTY